MIYEVYYNEVASNIRVTLFDIEIYNPTIVVRPALGNFLTYFHKRCNDKEFDKESFVRDSDYMNMLYGEMFPLIDRKAPFNQILDRLELIINRYGITCKSPCELAKDFA